MVPQHPEPLTAEGLIAKALERGTPVDALERLLAMRREIQAENARNAFFASLKAFQATCPAIPRGREVKNRDGTLRYRYAPLEDIVRAVSPVLRDNGLAYRLNTEVADGHLVATCFIHHDMGHVESSQFRVPIDRSAQMNQIQQYGAAGTYAKRYAFCNALGILTADEDTDAASEPVIAAASPSPAPTRPAPAPAPAPVRRAAPAPAKPVVKQTEMTVDPDSYRDDSPEPGSPEAQADEWWKGIALHFGPQKGTLLGALHKSKLYGWCMNYEPKAYRGEIAAADQQLRDALDAAKTHYNFGERERE